MYTHLYQKWLCMLPNLCYNTIGDFWETDQLGSSIFFFSFRRQIVNFPMNSAPYSMIVLV